MATTATTSADHHDHDHDYRDDEVRLVQATSGLTLGVFGNIKEVLTIALAMSTFGERPSPLNLVGLAIVAGSSIAYKRLKV